MLRYFCPRVGVLTSCVLSIANTGGWLLTHGMKVLAPHLAFSYISVGVLGWLIIVLREWNSRLLSWPVLVWVWVGPQLFFLWCLAAVELLLSKVFYLVRLALFWSLGLLFFVCACCYFWLVSFFHSKSGLYEAKRKLSISQWILRSLASLSSLHL